MLNIGLLFKIYLNDKDIIMEELYKLGKEFQVTFYELNKDKQMHENCITIPKHPKTDFILCFGGDGTMLRSMGYSLLHQAPVLGVNLGKVGFLSDTSLKDLKKSIYALVNKKYRIENRMLLDIQAFRGHETIFKGIALNEIVLFKGNNSKLINLRLYANRQYVYEVRSDGLVICTPTGSTAYSLSAGGPICSSAMKAIIATPLNPHILTVRPFVFDKDEIIEIRIPAKQQVYLQTDGNSRCELQYQDKIIIKKSKETIKFVKLTQKTFYRILRKKLQMGKI